MAKKSAAKKSTAKKSTAKKSTAKKTTRKASATVAKPVKKADRVAKKSASTMHALSQVASKVSEFAEAGATALENLTGRGGKKKPSSSRPQA